MAKISDEEANRLLEESLKKYAMLWERLAKR